MLAVALSLVPAAAAPVRDDGPIGRVQAVERVNPRHGPDGEYGKAPRRATLDAARVAAGSADSSWMVVEGDGTSGSVRRAGSVPAPARAGWPAGRRFRECARCPELVVVPAGKFLMSGPAGDDEESPARAVTIAEPIAVGVYEVTFGEWDACVSEGGCAGYRPEDEGWGRGRRPVINVSWEDAQAYVRWLAEKTGQRYRLPSESEWEYAARAGSAARYWWGDEPGRNRANCRGCGSRWDGERTAPVGSFASNGFGLHDVQGNVWEWVEDCGHEDRAAAPPDGSARTSGGNCRFRMRRGGSWDVEPEYLRFAWRDWDVAGGRFDNDGFRVVRTLAP